MKTFIYTCICIFLNFSLFAQHLIPVPSRITSTDKGKYNFDSTEKIYISDCSLQNEAHELQKILRQRTGYPSEISLTDKKQHKNIVLQIDTTLSHPEAYRLIITPQAICISGKKAAGIFYGIQTLEQLFFKENGQSPHKNLPCLKIEDTPRYGYRALMLDPARHFIPIKEIKRFIDLMAHYKFNVLQLHLTDDQGWRIEIKKYPLLTKAGAFRDKHSGPQGPHNGFYTQEELKDLINYATSRHIEIIPELDIPGHTAALLYAYPELGCIHMNNGAVQLGKTTDRTLCAAQEKVYEFYAGILQEVCSLFPSQRIHLGGDEAVIGKNWGHCPDCQHLMQTKGYEDVREIMGYFFGRIHQMVKQNKKELMLWCELDNIRLPAREFLFPYPQDCTLFTWRMGLTPKTIELTGKSGIKLIASPGEHCYLDYPQYKGDLPEFNNWGMPVLTLSQSYNWDPGYGLPAKQQEHIIGVAGLLWAEAMQDINRITYMAYPRALALAEAGWSSPENRNWENFKTNLVPHLSELMKRGISFRVPFEIYESSNSEKRRK